MPTMRLRAALSVALVGLSLAVVVPTATAVPDPPSHEGAGVPQPTIALPPEGTYGHPLWDSWFDLGEYGYEEQEYFVSGTATAGAATAPYTTRIIVFRPTAASGQFNGTVLLDWVNVTAQFENAVDSIEAHEFLLREGYAWVHVSAQVAGLDTPLVPNPLVPKKWDPARYAAINHPGDQYAFDMFSQIAKAVKDGGLAGPDPMGSLDVDYVLAAGQSQSASKLTEYVNSHQETADVIDGFLIHGTFGGDGPAASDVPVIHLESDADVALGATPHDNIALWEVAGAAHSDYWIGYHSVFGNGPRSQLHAAKVSRAEKERISIEAGNYGEQVHPLLAACTLAGAAMPMHYVTSSAIAHLDKWVRGGATPDSGVKINTDRLGSVLAGQFGNTQGGIRLAPMEVPVASYQSTVCQLGGKTIPFSEVQLLAMYGSHQSYYAKFKAAVAQNVTDGWLLPDDATDLLKRACDSRNRFGTPQATAVSYCLGYAPTLG
ncbi:MAG: alpha/beta hydrolase domain-containing protein [Acidimicrobiales bacterium]